VDLLQVVVVVSATALQDLVAVVVEQEPLIQETVKQELLTLVVAVVPSAVAQTTVAVQV
jgi:hypothetical protein